MFYAYIPLFPYMGANLGQMPAAAALRLLRLRLRLQIPAADRGTVCTQMDTILHQLRNKLQYRNRMYEYLLTKIFFLIKSYQADYRINVFLGKQLQLQTVSEVYFFKQSLLVLFVVFSVTRLLVLQIETKLCHFEVRG